MVEQVTAGRAHREIKVSDAKSWESDFHCSWREDMLDLRTPLEVRIDTPRLLLTDWCCPRNVKTQVTNAGAGRSSRSRGCVRRVLSHAKGFSVAKNELGKTEVWG